MDEYLATLHEDVRAVLLRVRAVIRKALPEAAEAISYQIPTFKVGGRPVIHFAGWKEHYSLYPANGPLLAALKTELMPYRVSKGTIRFPLGEPVPVGLIARIAKLRAQEVADRVSLKPKLKGEGPKRDRATAGAGSRKAAGGRDRKVGATVRRKTAGQARRKAAGRARGATIGRRSRTTKG
jgi:uncharacterized protein YdhG (YjbR/CyaY superfamily)